MLLVTSSRVLFSVSISPINALSTSPSSFHRPYHRPCTPSVYVVVPGYVREISQALLGMNHPMTYIPGGVGDDGKPISTARSGYFQSILEQKESLLLRNEETDSLYSIS